MDDKKIDLNTHKAYLSWRKKDFEKSGEEVPSKLLNDEIHSEGELMSEEEITSWVIDTQKTFKIVKERNEAVFNKLYQGYILDLAYLQKIGKINEDIVDELLKIENFEF